MNWLMYTLDICLPCGMLIKTQAAKKKRIFSFLPLVFSAYITVNLFPDIEVTQKLLEYGTLCSNPY
ncbi:hypothetical protein JOC76_002990 [Neobacillus cucumis]|nr:hypothetical protein [Neobacillus cucumis]